MYNFRKLCGKEVVVLSAIHIEDSRFLTICLIGTFPNKIPNDKNITIWTTNKARVEFNLKDVSEVRKNCLFIRLKEYL